MAIPHIVALYQWLRSKPGMSFPLLSDGAFAPEVIDDASMQSTTNKDIFIKRVARLRAAKQMPKVEDLKLAWFDNSDDYDGLSDFIGFIHDQTTKEHHHPLQVTLDYLLRHPTTAANPLEAFTTLFAVWLNSNPVDAIAWYEDEGIQEKLLSTHQEIPLALGRLVTEHYLKETRALFKSVNDPMGLMPLFAEHYDNPERIAAFFLGLLEEGAVTDDEEAVADIIINDGLLHQFFISNIGISPKKITQLYGLLHTIPAAQCIAKKSKNISVMTLDEKNAGYEFYSLDGTEHFEGCGLIKISALELDEFHAIDKAGYILTDTGLIYYNKTTNERETIVLNESQFTKFITLFGEDKRFATEGRINSLTVEQIKKIATITGHTHLKQLQRITPKNAQFYAVPKPEAFNPLYHLFGQQFLLHLLNSYRTSHHAGMKQILEQQFNHLSGDGLSQQELMQLLNVLARENKEPLLPAVAELLQESTINVLIDSGNFAVFHLIPFKPLLLDKLNLEQVQRYIASIRPNDNPFDQLILLRTMLAQLKSRCEASEITALVFDKMVEVLMSSPNLDDTRLIETLRSVADTPRYKELLQQQAILLATQLNQSIQAVMATPVDLTPDTLITLGDEWRSLSRKLDTLKEISPDLTSDFPRDKYVFYVSVVKAAVRAHEQAQSELKAVSPDYQVVPFNLQATLSHFFPVVDEQELLLHHPVDAVSEHERTLIEVIAAIDNETLWAQAILLLEAPPIHRLDWTARDYGGHTIVEVAAKQGNNPLIQYLLKENKLKSAAVSHLLKTAIAASQWDTVKQLIHLTQDNKPDIESVSEALVAATKAGQLDRLLRVNDAPAPGLFPTQPNRIRLPVEPASLTALTTAHGEEETVKQLIKLSPELLKSLVTRTNVIDYSGRTFTNISPFQYSLWAMDWHMWDMMLDSLQEAFNEGYTDAEVIREEMLRQYKEVVDTHGVDYTLNGEAIRGERHFDLKPLIDALDTYVKNFDSWDWPHREEHWCQVVGQLQRLVPAHVAQHYCEEKSFDGNKPFHGANFSRSLQFNNMLSGGIESWFPLSQDNRLGFDFAIYNFAARGGARDGRRRARAGCAGVPDAAEANLTALSALCKVGTNNVEALSERLATPLQKRDLDASYGVS